MSELKRNVIIGNSAAGLSALETLRRNDPDCEITLISREKGPAYSLVLLPYFIAGDIDKSRITITNQEYYQSLKANTIFEKTVIEIDTKRGHVLLNDGAHIPYDNLIICTGAFPNALNVEGEHLIPLKSLRTLGDALEIKGLFQIVEKILVIGAGLINLKLISLMRGKHIEFTVVEVASKILANMLDQSTAAIVENKMVESGVRLYKECILTKIKEGKEGKPVAVLSNGVELETDAVLFNIGISPNISFMRSSGILVNKGVLIDQFARTNVPNIYAAGDVVSVRERISGKYMNIGNWFNAIEQGKTAAHSIAGIYQEYEGCLNINITDLFGITVLSFGDFNGTGESLKSIVSSDIKRNYYKKIFVSEGQMIGGIFLNEKRSGGIFKSLLGEKISDLRFPEIIRNKRIMSIAEFINYSKVRKGFKYV
jgi:NAD(P)H-nitrite reductase large subunit